MQSTEQEQKPAAAGQFDGLLNVFKNRWKKNIAKKNLPNAFGRSQDISEPVDKLENVDKIEKERILIFT